MDLLPLIIQLVSGAIGGNAAGKLLKDIDQGTLINSIAGIVGGGIGGQILSALLSGSGAPVDATAVDAAAGGLDVASIISSVAGGGVGGGLLLAIVGFIRKSMAK